MNDSRPRPYVRLLAQGRLAALVAISVVAGAAGGAWAVAGAPGLDRVTVMTVSDSSATDDSTAGESAEPQKSKEPKPEKSGKAAESGKPAGAGPSSKAPKAGRSGASDAHGIHGQCVRAVATSDATGGPNDNHGGAVSAAAKSCPRPTPVASGSS